MFWFQDRRGPVEVAFTDRQPGDGAGREGSLDLAEPKAGSPDPDGDLTALDENLDILAWAMVGGVKAPGDRSSHPPSGVQPPVLVTMRQVHGSDVQTIDQAWLDAGREAPTVDGMVTTIPGVALVVRAADCVPVLLADVEHGVAGAAHAGRNGMLARVVPNTVARMRELGADRVAAWVGPCICGRCYEVPAQMREEAAALVPESFAETSWGTPALDVAAGVLAQLKAADVEVVDASGCTFENEDLYSYRRQGARAGRLAGVVWVRP